MAGGWLPPKDGVGDEGLVEAIVVARAAVGELVGHGGLVLLPPSNHLGPTGGFIAVGGNGEKRFLFSAGVCGPY